VLFSLKSAQKPIKVTVDFFTWQLAFKMAKEIENCQYCICDFFTLIDAKSHCANFIDNNGLNWSRVTKKARGKISFTILFGSMLLRDCFRRV
jgi:hypothetical protein